MCLPILSGAEPFVLNDSSRCLSKEHSLYSCGGLVLHVWKHVSISVQREGRVGVSLLLRDNFGRHSAASAIVAAECRKSWSLIRGKPARSRIDLKYLAR